MRPFFLYVILLPQAFMISELCFKLVSSIVRRDSVGVITTTSQLGCNIRCVDTPGCDACIFYADQGKCVLLGKPQAPPPGQCPIPYTCYEKAYSGCQMRSPFPPDRGYTPGPCSNPSDMVNAPTAAKVLQVCGMPPPGSRRLFLDAILHDGTRLSLDNDMSGYIDWDPYIGSWFYYVHTTTIYFKSGYCIHPANPHLKIEDKDEDYCRLMLKRAWPGTQRAILATSESLLYCANGEWMLLLEVAPQYNEASLVDVTCVL